MNEEENLLAETVGILSQHGKSPADVAWIGRDRSDDENAEEDAPSEWVCGSWSDFAKFAAELNYDSGFGGGIAICTSLIIVGADWWLERHAYDGSEWWEFKTLPTKPTNAGPLTESDLRYE